MGSYIFNLSITVVAIATGCFAQDACKGVPTDVIFLVDASMTSDDDFRSALTFVDDVTSRLAIGVYDTKVALVKFGIRYRKIFTLATYKDKDSVLAAIRNVTRSGGVPGTYSDLGDALSLAKTQLTVPSYGRRLAARLLVVVVTSRTDSIAASVTVNTQALRERGATIYAIGVGPLIPANTLTAMASSDQTKFAVSTFSELTSLEDQLVSSMCPNLNAPSPNPGGSVSVADCPAAVPRDKYLQVRGGLCYEFVVYRQKDFWDSERDCATRGGHLVSIKDQATNTYILNELEHVYNIHSAVWIGLHDSGTEGNFVWTDGTDAYFLNFGNGGLDKDNDCIAMDPNPNSNAGIWIEYHCIEGTWTKPIQHGYVCQYLPVGSNSSTAAPATTASPKATTTTAKTTTVPTTEATTTTTTAATTAVPTTTIETTSTTTSAPVSMADVTVTTSTASPSTTSAKMTTTSTDVKTTSADVITTSSDVQVCPPFSCDVDCGLEGYQQDAVGCQICQCNV